MLPLISVILPVHNGEKFLKKAIQSCLDQTYDNFELIVVNDCSTDGSMHIAKDFQRSDDRIKIISNDTNLKLPASLNKGHKIAKGEYITWTSDDNITKPEYLQELYKTLIEKNCDVVFSDYDIIWEDGTIKREQVSGPVSGLIFGDTVGASFLYKKEVFEELKGYNENLFLVEDYHFFLRASFGYKFYHLKKNLYQYRIHGESLSVKIERDIKYKRKFRSNLTAMYEDIRKYIPLDDSTIELLVRLYIQDAIAMRCYLSNRKTIEKDIYNYQVSIISSDADILRNLDFLIRENWYRKRKHLTLKNLITVLQKKNSLVLGNYNRNWTIMLVIKCILNPRNLHFSDEK